MLTISQRQRVTDITSRKCTNSSIRDLALLTVTCQQDPLMRFNLFERRNKPPMKFPLDLSMEFPPDLSMEFLTGFPIGFPIGFPFISTNAITPINDYYYGHQSNDAKSTKIDGTLSGLLYGASVDSKINIVRECLAQLARLLSYLIQCDVHYVHGHITLDKIVYIVCQKRRYFLIDHGIPDITIKPQRYSSPSVDLCHLCLLLVAFFDQPQEQLPELFVPLMHFFDNKPNPCSQKLYKKFKNPSSEYFLGTKTMFDQSLYDYYKDVPIDDPEKTKHFCPDVFLQLELTNSDFKTKLAKYKAVFKPSTLSEE